MKKIIALLIIITVIILLINFKSNDNAPNYVDPHPNESIASVNH